MNKYRNVPTVVDGITFASKREAKRYAELKLLEKAKQIRGLELQPKFPCIVDGKKVCTYIADFGYWEGEGHTVEDVKSPASARNPTYRLKKKLVEALYPGTTITEVF